MNHIDYSNRGLKALSCSDRLAEYRLRAIAIKEFFQVVFDTRPAFVLGIKIIGTVNKLSYAYDLESEDITDSEMLDGVFEELRGIMDLIYEKTKYNIDQSWYSGEDDPAKGY